jgi:hypothetical protein
MDNKVKPSKKDKNKCIGSIRCIDESKLSNKISINLIGGLKLLPHNGFFKLSGSPFPLINEHFIFSILADQVIN